MATASLLTLHLAQGIALYLLLSGLSAFTAPERWRRTMEEFAASAALPLVTGVFTLLLGLTLVILHCLWTDPLAVIVTLVGWIALVEGALLIVAPQLMMRIGAWSIRIIRVWAVAVLILGLLLGFAAVTAHVDAAAVIV